MAIRARIERVSGGSLIGWAADKSTPELSFDLQLFVDGQAVPTCVADRKRADLQRAGYGEGAHGFECPLPATVTDGAEHDFAICIAGSSGAPPLAEARLLAERLRHRLQGRIERYADGRLIGWVWDRSAPSANIGLELLVGDEVRGRALANQFRRDLQLSGIGIGDHGFSFAVRDVADGTRLVVRATAEWDHWVVGTASWPILPQAHHAKAKPTAPLKPAQPLRELEELLAGAREAERQKNYPEAAKLLDDALLGSPRSVDALFLRSRIAVALNDTAGAQKWASAAVRAQPDHMRAVVILARLASSAGSHAEAIELWERIGPGENAYRERLVKRGRSLMATGRPLEALAEFLSAARDFPGDGLALRSAAEAAEMAGGLRSAIGHWRRYLSATPQDKKAQLHVQHLERHLAEAAAATTSASTEASLSPLQDPWLRHWVRPVQGAVSAEGGEISSGVRLGMRTGSGRLRYAAAAPSAYRPGDRPGYGVWLHADGGQAELSFALSDASRESLLSGLEMVVPISLATSSAQAGDELQVVLVGRNERQLLHYALGAQHALVPFILRLTLMEARSLAEGQLDLSLRLAARGPVVMRPPRVVRRLDAAPAPAEGAGYEDAVAMSGLIRLGLLPGERGKAA